VQANFQFQLGNLQTPLVIWLEVDELFPRVLDARGISVGMRVSPKAS